MGTKFILLLFCLFAGPCVSDGANLHDALTNFLRKTIEDFRSKMKVGIPDIGVPVLDPFNMEDKHIESKDEKAKLTAELSNVVITGLSDFYIQNLDVDVDQLVASVEFHFKSIKGEGNYKVDGTVLSIFPITGDGPFWVKADEVASRGRVVMQRDGRYLKIVDSELELTTGEISGHFDNILGGGELGEVFNLILNKFGKRIIDSYSPILMEKVVKSLQDHANDELAKIPVDDLLDHTTVEPTSYEPEESTVEFSTDPTSYEPEESTIEFSTDYDFEETSTDRYWTV